LSVLILDLDHFSTVNDRYGHAAGDAALRQMVARIHKCLRRDRDWCARLGGDEFVVVLPQTDAAGARVMSEMLLREIRDAPMGPASGVAMTVSIGAGVAGRGGEQVSAEELLDHADHALYQSKRAGRNQVTMPGTGVRRETRRAAEERSVARGR
jgi:diguanylate cyclase (GGDEF)-like protein